MILRIDVRKFYTVLSCRTWVMNWKKRQMNQGN